MFREILWPRVGAGSGRKSGPHVSSKSDSTASIRSLERPLRAPQEDAPGNANFAKEITPVVCPEAQQNPSHPVISESYRGSEHALPDPKNCMVAARANVGFHKY